MRMFIPGILFGLIIGIGLFNSYYAKGKHEGYQEGLVIGQKVGENLAYRTIGEAGFKKGIFGKNNYEYYWTEYDFSKIPGNQLPDIILNMDFDDSNRIYFIKKEK